MSIIFGRIDAAAADIALAEIMSLGAAMSMYGKGKASVSSSDHVSMGFQPFGTGDTADIQPLKDGLNHLLTFDGRLDNRDQLANDLSSASIGLSDAAIVLRAFVHWGENCFARFVGDWALSLWSERERALYLARDHAGARTLYYRRDANAFTWSTYLDVFLREADGLAVSNEYMALYLASLPLGKLTPYKGIFSVSPGRYLRVRDTETFECEHWNASTRQTLRYKSNAQYEEHFLSLLKQSVARRTAPGSPIIAELSGGMDSSSIVCVSDHLRRSADPDSELLDTVSYFDDSEPSLNDAPFYTLVEKHRGKAGTHINTAISQRTFKLFAEDDPIYRVPGADASFLERERLFRQMLWDKEYRCVLSGAGGDELLGGVPDHLPELSNYMMSGSLGLLIARAFRWSLAERTTLLGELRDTVAYTARLYGPSCRSEPSTAPWIRTRSKELQVPQLPWRDRLTKSPVELDNANGWAAVTARLPHLFPLSLFRPEYRYPLLDRDLVEFLFGIPREQLLEPGRRRSLMRRALVGIVPTGILERRRKAFQLSAPLKALAASQHTIKDLFADPLLAKMSLIEPRQLLLWLERTAAGDPTWRQALIKTICLELWLRAVCQQKERSELSKSFIEFDRSHAISRLRGFQQTSC